MFYYGDCFPKEVQILLCFRDNFVCMCRLECMYVPSWVRTWGCLMDVPDPWKLNNWNWRYLMGFWERNHDPLQEQKELYTLNHHLSSCTPILNLLICTTFLDWVVFSHYSMFLIILSSLGKIPLLYFLKGKKSTF